MRTTLVLILMKLNKLGKLKTGNYLEFKRYRATKNLSVEKKNEINEEKRISQSEYPERTIGLYKRERQ